MPPENISSLADEFNVSEEEAEEAWDEAKEKVIDMDDRPDDQEDFSDEDWGLVFEITRNILKGQTETDDLEEKKQKLRSKISTVRSLL